MAIIIGVGVSFYAISTKMIRDIYASSLSADRNLLNAMGVSSFETVSWNDIQNRIDEQIAKYTNSLNIKSSILLSMKETLQSVDDFHRTVYSLQNVFQTLNGALSISYFGYDFKGSTPLEISEFMLKENAQKIVEEEKRIFEKSGYEAVFVKNPQSQWYKTTKETLYLRSAKK